MTTKFKDNEHDVDQLYVGTQPYSSLFYVGGNVVIRGTHVDDVRTHPFNITGYGYLNEDLWDDIWVSRDTNQAENYYIFLKKSSKIYFMGRADWQMIPGIPDGTFVSSPVLMSNDSWIMMTASHYNVWGIKADGSLWGTGDKNQLGGTFDWRPIASGIVSPRAAWFPRNKFVKSKSAMVSTGKRAFFIDVSSNLWGIGNSDFGSLGNGSTNPVSSWVQIGTNKWIIVTSAADTTLGIDTSNRLWAWGANALYTLGTGATNSASYSTPVQVGSATTWLDVHLSHSADHVLAIQNSTSKYLYAWGKNDYGQLGVGSVLDKSTPVQVTGVSNVFTVSSGNGTSYFIKGTAEGATNTLYAWGKNDVGQLGIGSTANKSTPVLITLPHPSGWVFIAANTAGAHAIQKWDGTTSRVLYSWGSNSYGELGFKDQLSLQLSTPTAVWGTAIERLFTYSKSMLCCVSWVMADAVTTFINYSGIVYATGVNNGYSDRAGTETTMTEFEMFGNDATIYITDYVSNGAILAYYAPSSWGYYSLLHPHWLGIHLGVSPNTTCNNAINPYDNTRWCTSSFVKLGSNSWTTIIGCSDNANFLRSDGTLWGISMSANAYCGSRTVAPSSSLIQVGSYAGGFQKISGNEGRGHAIDLSGRLWGWGWNGAYDVGDGTSSERVSPKLIDSNTDWTQVMNLMSGGSAIRSNTLYIWGKVGPLTGESSATYKSTPIVCPTNFSWLTGDQDMFFGIKGDGTLWATLAGSQTSYSCFYTDDERYITNTLSSIPINPWASSPVQISGKTTWIKLHLLGWNTFGLLSGKE